jgi:hypothetical protein
MSKNEQPKFLTERQLAAALGISNGTARKFRKAGMPADLDGAKNWHALRRRPRIHEFKKNAVNPAEVDVEGETLESAIPRMRRLEKATAEALERAIAADRVMESVMLCKGHLAALIKSPLRRRGEVAQD